ncbi:MAG: NF038130 family PEP-CTERM protein [Leptolyngbyaceae cyanobacterium bins.59]|nr:NF038130 family PEP-CTERM protein [Leptolyngbyaceae cyanobacterium bins.59]
MLRSIKRIAIGTSMALGASAIAVIPAFAQSSLTGISMGGSQPGDYKVYDANGTNTLLVTPSLLNVQKVLDGNATNPTGNVELAGSSELSTFNFLKNTTLTGTIGGKSLTLSSLTAQDWFGPTLNTAYGADTLATSWFNNFLTKAGKGSLVGTSSAASAFNLFGQLRGFQRTSDPNISYVNQDDSGLIRIGMAGHFDLKAFYSNPTSGFSPFASLLPDGFQASEVVKYTYNGKTDYLYGFSATRTGLTEGSDGQSHSGNYEVTIQGVASTPVPEPSAMLGLAAIGGLFAAAKRKVLKKA